MNAPRILIGCEVSGNVRDAFLARGFDCWSCDLRPSRKGGPHIVGDIRRVLRFACWHCAILFPPCQYLAASGLHWNLRDPQRAQHTEQALSFVAELLAAPVPMLALENPRGCIGTRIRPADQTLQPFQFRADASKATCLWLRNLPRLRPTGWVEGRDVDGVTRWSNQTDSGQNRLAPSPERADKRAETYPEIADAMALQWGEWIRRNWRPPPEPVPPPVMPLPEQLTFGLMP